MSRKRSINSAYLVAKLLGTEGFSPYTAQQVKRYWLRSSDLTKRQSRQIRRLHRALTKLCEKLDEGDRLVLGKIIGLHKKMGFDVGLKIGLQVFATENNRAIDARDEMDMDMRPIGAAAQPECFERKEPTE